MIYITQMCIISSYSVLRGYVLIFDSIYSTISDLEHVNPFQHLFLIILRRHYRFAPIQQNQNKANKRNVCSGYTSILGNPLPLQFLIVLIPTSYSGHMISIPKQISHRHPNSKRNTDIKKDLA